MGVVAWSGQLVGVVTWTGLLVGVVWGSGLLMTEVVQIVELKIEELDDCTQRDTLAHKFCT